MTDERARTVPARKSNIFKSEGLAKINQGNLTFHTPPLIYFHHLDAENKKGEKEIP
jgi:hypothetical protein